MSEKPLIALLTNNEDDVYCFRLELLESIQGAGYRLLISCPDGPKLSQPELQKLDFIYDDPPIDRRGTDLRSDAKLFLHYYKLFRRHRPDVVLAYTAKPNVYGSLAARTLKIPVINNVTGFGSVLKKSGMIRKFIMQMFKIAYSGSSCIMFQNSTNMEMAKQLGMARGEYHLIPGSGVNPARFPLLHYPEGGDGKEGDTVVFNYIGRVMYDKGVDDYFAAARRIREKYPKTEFDVLGFIEPTEIAYEDKLKDLEKEGLVYYRGNQTDVKPWIERSHALIHPSVYGEGMSNVLLENASSGRPLITTDNPGCRETVDDGSNGWIYSGGDVDELVRKIEAFLRMPNSERRQMGRKGREKVEREFNRQVVIDAYLEKIQDLVKSRYEL